MTPTAVGRWDVLAARLPLVALAGYAVLAVVLSGLAWLVGPADSQVQFGYLDGPSWLDIWFHGDAGWYVGIAAGGYTYTPGLQSPVAFFPAYPLTVRAVGGLLGGDLSTAAGLVTLFCGAGVVMLFADWVRTRVAARTAVVAVAVLLLYPYSFFLYGSGYSDALFLLTALGALALLERRHYLLAAVVGILATGGRPIGVAVLAALVVRGLELLAEDRASRSSQLLVTTGGPPHVGDTREVPPRSPVPFRDLFAAIPRSRWREYALLLSGLGLVGWMVYLGVRFGDPVAFATVQEAPGWNQGSGPYTWFKIVFIGTLIKGLWVNIALLVPQALACLAAVLLVRTVWRRFGWGYAAYTVVSLVIPIIGTKDFMGAGRYVLAAYPVMAAAAVVLTDRRRPRFLVPLVLTVLLVGSCIATVAFARGVEVS